MTFTEFLKQKSIFVSDGELCRMRPMGLMRHDFKTQFCMDDLEEIFNEHRSENAELREKLREALALPKLSAPACAKDLEEASRQLALKDRALAVAKEAIEIFATYGLPPNDCSGRDEWARACALRNSIAALESQPGETQEKEGSDE